MDMMSVKSKILTAIASRIIKKLMWQSTGINADFDVHQVSFVYEDGKVKGHLDLDLELDDSEFTRIFKNMGL